MRDRLLATGATNELGPGHIVMHFDRSSLDHLQNLLGSIEATITSGCTKTGDSLQQYQPNAQHEPDASNILQVIDEMKTALVTLRAQCDKRHTPPDNPLTQRPEYLEDIVTERSTALLEAQRQILQQEKLASVGRLAAGIAHELNTPIQYVGDNLRALSDYFDDLASLLNNYREFVHAAKSGTPNPESIDKLEAAEQARELDYIIEDVPKAIEQGLEGVQRVSHIVRAMKDFSHVDRGRLSAIDINHTIQSTLTVARNEYKYVADIETDFGELPAVECYANEISQVLLNLLVNAAHAISDTGTHGTITIRTRLIDDQVAITFADTGTGIPKDICQNIFDPFFTTKEVGKGTGQGLYISHQIVADKHKGSLTFETQAGKGTTFFIRIPLRAPKVPQQEEE